MKKLKIEGIENNLPKIRNFVEKCLNSYNIEKDTAEDVIISSDEVCANIIRHNYKNRKNKYIDIEITKVDNNIIVDIIDEGTKFNLLKHKKMKSDKNLRDIKNNGLGLFILKKLIDKVEYRYIKGRGNHIRLIKSSISNPNLSSKSLK